MWETRSVFHIPMPRLLRQDGVRCRRPIAQRRVRPLRVVFHPPPLRQNLCLLQRVKHLAVQKLISQLPVEALTVPVLPRTPRLDVQRPRAQLAQPLPQLLGNKLRHSPLPPSAPSCIIPATPSPVRPATSATPRQ